VILSEEDIEYAIEKGILKKEGVKKISFLNDKLTWNSTRGFFNLYYENNKFLNILHNKIMKSMQNDLFELREKLLKKASE
jgi:hypothetical protein